MATHSPTSCFGSLSKLPIEICREIWAYVPLNSEDLPQQHSTCLRNFTAILRTSQCMREKAEEFFYKGMTVDFDVGPVYEKPEPWLEVLINGCMRTSFMNARCSRISSFVRFLSHHLEKVTVSISAAEEEFRYMSGRSNREVTKDGASDDQTSRAASSTPTYRVPDSTGQILCLFRRCTDIASLLKQVPAGMLNLEISFVDTNVGYWFSQDTETGEDTEAHFGPTFFGEFYGAFFIMLTTFNMIRGARQAQILIPQHDRQLMEQAGDDIVQQYEDLLGPNRTILSHQVPTDEFLQEERDQVSLDLEAILDSESGRVAQMLRLHRYANWYLKRNGQDSKRDVSEYEAEVERIIFSPGLTDAQRLLSADAMCMRKSWYAVIKPRSGLAWFKAYPKGICTVDHKVSARDQRFFKRVCDWIVERDGQIPPEYEDMRAGGFSRMRLSATLWQLSGDARFDRGSRT